MITVGSVITATIRISPRHRGQANGSTSKIRRSSSAQRTRAARSDQSAGSTIENGDILLVTGNVETLIEAKATEGIEIRPDWKLSDVGLLNEETKMVEALVSPQSRLVGRTLKEADYRQEQGLTVLAVHRLGRSLRGTKRRDQTEGRGLVAGAEPSCILVYGPGKYGFSDFVKTGALLTLILAVVVLLFVPVCWPLHPVPGHAVP